MEAVHQESGQLQVGQQEQSANVVNVKARNISPCWRCSKTGHVPNQCFFSSKQCRKCSKTGYIARMCHQQQLNSRPPTKATRPTQGKAQYVDQEEADEADINTSELGLFTIRTVSGRHTGSIIVTPEINGIPIQMELDTGASVTLISARV